MTNEQIALLAASVPLMNHPAGLPVNGSEVLKASTVYLEWLNDAQEQRGKQAAPRGTDSDIKVREDAPVSFKDARKIMAAALSSDADLRLSYVANVAMLLHDHHGITERAERNAAAESILTLILEG